MYAEWQKVSWYLLADILKVWTRRELFLHSYNNNKYACKCGMS